MQGAVTSFSRSRLAPVQDQALQCLVLNNSINNANDNDINNENANANSNVNVNANNEIMILK